MDYDDGKTIFFNLVCVRRLLQYRGIIGIYYCTWDVDTTGLSLSLFHTVYVLPNYFYFPVRWQ